MRDAARSPLRPAVSTGRLAAGRWLLLLGALALLLAPGEALGESTYYSKSLEISQNVDPDRLMIIESPGGSITVSTWERRDVRVEAVLEMLNIDERNKELFAKESQVTLEETPEGYRANVTLPEGLPIESRGLPSVVRGRITELGGGRWRYTPSAEITFEAKIPRSMALRVKTGYGDVDVQDLAGPVAIECESSEVRAERIGGNLEIGNSYGSVTATDCAARVEIRNESGAIRIEDAEGPIDARTSYERIEVRRARGPVRLRNESGSVSAEQIGGELDIATSYESVVASKIEGPVTIESGSGSITITDARQGATLTGSYEPIAASEITGDLAISAQSSGVTVSEVTGRVDIATSYEHVAVSDVGGPVSIEAPSSAVTVERAGDEVDIRASYEDISISEVAGDCRVRAESAEVIVAGVTGTVELRSSYERVEARDVGWDLTIQSDSSPVLVDGVGGALRVTSSYEYIIVKGTAGSIDIDGDSSPIEIGAIRELPAGSHIEARTSYDRITLYLPESASARVEARSSEGEIESEYPMTYDRDGIARAELLLGEGASRVRLVTSGDIRIRREP